MEVLETPYEQEITIDFIECQVCNKTIRGDSLYKIHLTTAGHMKKEDTLVFQGIAVRNCIVPDFADIEEYLRYLKLDEPIIGLNHLEEVSRSDPNDPQIGPRYACRLCDLDANLPNMVNHIIGRKHRQKYLEVKRPDLVSWNTAAPFSSSNSGKVIRTKAEVAERQDGKGTPKPIKKSLAKSVGRSNISRVPPQQKKKLNQNQRGVPSQSQEFTGFPGEYSHHSGRPLDDPNMMMPPYRTKDRYTSADAERGAYPGEGPPHRLEFAEDDYKSILGEYRGDTSRRNFPESSGGARRHPREEMTYGPTYREEEEEEAPLYRKPSAGSDPLREFMEAERGRVPSAEAAESRKRAYPGQHNPHGATAYAGDDPHGRAYPPEGSEQQATPPGLQGRTSIDYSHGRVPFDIDNHLRQRRSPGDPYSNLRSTDPHPRSYPGGGEGQDRAYPPEEDPYRPLLYPGANPQRRSLDREPSRPGNANGAGGGRREPSGQEAKRQRLAEPMEWQEGPAGGGDPGFGLRRGPPPPLGPNRLPEGARAMSDIPEPFRRFLQGAADDQMNDGKRRKKSRFSDATDEEIERAKGMLTDEYASPDQEMYGGPPGPAPDLHRAQRPGPYAQQGQYNTESYPRENPGSFSEKPPESGNVFDLMNNIEIEDVEEADFLKSKLCNLLKEFQAKKLEKTSKGQGPAGMSADYHHLGNDQQRAPPPGQHDRNFRDGPQQGQQHERNFAEEPQDRRYENQRRQPPQEARRQQQRDGDERGQFQQDDGSRGQPRPPPPPLGHPQDRGSSRSRYEVYIKQQRDRDERGQLQDDGGHGQRPPPPPGHLEDRGSSRSRYEEIFGGAGQGQLLPPAGGGVPEEPGALGYPERFNEPRNPHHHHPHHQHRPSGGNNREFFDHYPPANAFLRGGGEQGYGGGQQRRPHHSSSLDKITSTLLELVARK